MKVHYLACFISVALGGCTLAPPTSQKQEEIPDNVDKQVQSGPSSASELPSECRPATSAELESLYDLTEASVHELVTCGGIQMQVALSMKVMIFASNEELVSTSARADIRDVVEAVGMTVDNPFTQDTEGSWTMDAGGSAGSIFSLTFYDPATGDVVTEDPFSLDSYLLGVTARSSRTWEEMKRNPTARTTFTYEWTEEGPLAHLLADGGEIPNPVVIEMSLIELGGAALGVIEPDYGPFDSVQDIEVESKIHMVDDRSGVDIAYDVTGRRSTVRGLTSTGSLPFDIESLVSSDDEYVLQGQTDGLAFLRRGTLAGEIQYTVSGASIDLRVISDFGAGAAYPTPRWECL